MARTVASVVLVVIGLILAPLGIVAGWAHGQLTDTGRFVSTFAPLATDPAVKALVVSEVMGVVDERVDFAGTTSDVIDALNGLGVPERAADALDGLKTPAALGLRSLATGAVTDVVDSPAFADIWEQTLRLSHAQLVAALTSDPDSALAVSSAGQLTIELGPVVSAVKAVMIARGLGFAEAIPDIDRSIVVAQSDGLAQARTGYGLAVAVGAWLPWAAFLLVVAGVLLARRRWVTLFRSAVALALVMVLLGVALRIGDLVAVSSLAPRYLPVDAAQAISGRLVSGIAPTVVMTAVVAVVVAAIGWLAGPYRPARALRTRVRDGMARLRRADADTSSERRAT